MKQFQIELSKEAKANIREVFFFIHERSPQNGETWVRGLYQRINTLKSMPDRCGLIREHKAFEDEVRELLYRSHRVIFTIDVERLCVKILTVRHSSRDEFTDSES